MPKQAAVPAFLLALILLGQSGCARSVERSQMRLALRASQQGGWDEAVLHWKKVLERDSRSAAAHNNLAVAYEKKGLWDEARREYEEALRIAPDHPRIRYNYEQFKNNLKAVDSGGGAGKGHDENR